MNKFRVKKTYTIRFDLVQILDKYRERTGMPYNYIVERALEQWFKDLGLIRNGKRSK